MPELPEVETIVRDLRSRLVNRRVRSVTVRLQKMINLPARRFASTLKGRTVTAIRRRGKVIIVELGPQWRLLIHLKMTGQLIWQKGTKSIAGGHTLRSSAERLPNKHTHAIFSFADGGILYFNDLRQFGWLRLYCTDEADRAIAAFRHGPEPLLKQFTPDYLWRLTRRYLKRPIKSLLLDQALIAGIGNIYADETLFAARIKPTRTSGSLTPDESRTLVLSIKHILRLAIKAKGTTVRNYRRGHGERGGFERYLKVFHRDGLPCRRCSSIIRKIRLGGRGTHFCPSCQR